VSKHRTVPRVAGRDARETDARAGRQDELCPGDARIAVPAKPGAELWYDDRDIPALKEDIKKDIKDSDKDDRHQHG